MTSARSHAISRPDLITCSAITDPLAFFFSTCLLCSFKRSPRFRSVSPMYTASHSIQGTLYKTPFLSLSGIESFKPLHMGHFQGEARCATSMPSGRSTLPIASLIPRMYGTDTHVNLAADYLDSDSDPEAGCNVIVTMNCAQEDISATWVYSEVGGGGIQWIGGGGIWGWGRCNLKHQRYILNTNRRKMLHKFDRFVISVQLAKVQLIQRRKGREGLSSFRSRLHERLTEEEMWRLNTGTWQVLREKRSGS